MTSLLDSFESDTEKEHGVLRRSKERNLAINERLEIILDRIAKEMSVDDIEKRMLVLKQHYRQVKR